LSRGVFGLFEFAQGRFPSCFEFSGDQTIVRITAVVLPLREGRLIAESLEPLGSCAFDLLVGVFLSSHGAGVEVQFDR
jgi:hypothetical protein